MKKIIGLLLTALLISVLLSCNKKNSVEPNSTSDHINPDSVFTDIDTALHIQSTQEGILTIYKIDKYNTVVVKIPHISSYLYFQQPTKALEQIAQDSNYALVVNASYFDHFRPDSIDYYLPAGFLRINDSIYSHTKPYDAQIQRLFAYDSKNNIVNYFDITELDKTNAYDLVVQIGPQIIWKNEIDTASINASINGKEINIRTTFASVDGKEFYVIVTLDLVTLVDLGKMLRSTGIFRKELNIINFDGGPSTHLYVRNHPEFCWWSDVRMPLLICVK